MARVSKTSTGSLADCHPQQPPRAIDPACTCMDFTFLGEKPSMSRFCLGIAGVVLGCSLAGCGDTEVDKGPVGFKPTDTTPFKEMTRQMQESMKRGAYKHKAAPEAKPAEAKPQEKKE
jgi:hypothetical protein